MNTTLTVGVISVLVGSIGGLVTAFLFPWTRKKLIGETKHEEASAAQEVSAAAVALLAPLRLEISDLRQRLATADHDADVMKSKFDEVTQRLDQALSDLRVSNDENARLRALQA